MTKWPGLHEGRWLRPGAAHAAGAASLALAFAGESMNPIPLAVGGVLGAVGCLRSTLVTKVALAAAFVTVLRLASPSPAAMVVGALSIVLAAVSVALAQAAVDRQLPSLATGAAPPAPLAGARSATSLALVAALLTALVAPPLYRQLSRLHQSGGGIPHSSDVQVDAGARGPRESRAEVMRVASDQPHYWRVTSYDAFDGRFWTRSPTPEELLQSEERLARLYEDDSLVSHTVVLTGDQRTDLYVSGLKTVAVDGTADDIQLGEDGTLRSPGLTGSFYTVTGEAPEVSPAELRATGDAAETPPGELDYLQLPPVSDRVAALAQEVTAAAPTRYEKVVAMEAWMYANLRYERATPAIDSADVVDDYLFETREGYCTQAATAMVVMLRSLGIPARLGTGFTAGELDGETGLFVVRAKNAHSWAEVYFPGVGWHIFDPTPPEPAPAAMQSSHLSLLFLVFGLAAVAIAGAVGWHGLRWVRRRLALRRAPWPTRMTRRLERFGADRGRPRRRGETVAEFADALFDTIAPDEAVIQISDEVLREAFSPDPLDPARRQRAEALLRELDAAHPRPGLVHRLSRR